MIITKIPIRTVKDGDDWLKLQEEIKSTLNLSSISEDIYPEISNTYNLPLHLVYIIIQTLKEDKFLKFEEISSVLYYAVCRDVLTPYKNKSYLFSKFFAINYPYLKNTDERLEWFLRHENGLSLTQKVSLLEEETSYNSMGVGRGRFERAINRIHLEATPEEIERRRLSEYDGVWAASIASFIPQERGDVTAAEVLLLADRLAEDTRINLKMSVLSSILSRMGKIEVYFLANQVTKFHDRVSRTSSLLRAFSKVFNVNYKTIERLTSMHSMVDVASLVEEDKILEQFEKIIPFRTFKPMLAAKWEQQYNFPMIVESKYDGVRLLLHKLGNKIVCFSRRRKNYMYKFHQIAQLGPVIPAFSLILDGEMTAQMWTPTGLKYLNIYELHDAVRDGNRDVQLIYVVFDILYMNGNELIEVPFKQRRKLRHELIKVINQSNISGIQIREVESFEVYSKEHLINAYNQFVTAGFEGAIVKNPNHKYDLGKRSAGWLKLKPKETLDVTITGIVPLQDARGIRAWGIRYAILREDEYVNIGMIRGLDSIAGNRIAELVVSAGLMVPNNKLVDLSGEIESKNSRFSQVKESMGFEIQPGIVITIDSLGIVRSSEKFSLRNARFLHIREDKDVEDISTYYDLYNEYMSNRLD